MNRVLVQAAGQLVRSTMAAVIWTRHLLKRAAGGARNGWTFVVRECHENRESKSALTGPRRSQSPPLSGRNLAPQQDDIEYNELRTSFHVGAGILQLRYQQLLPAGRLQEPIGVIVRLVFEIHLGDQPILLARNLKMDMWRSDAAAARIGARFDGFESVAPFRIGRQKGGALEIWIERRRVAVGWMRVTAMAVGLPNLDLGVRNRVSIDVDDPAGDIEHLPLGATGPTGQLGQVGRRFERLRYGIERAEDLIRRAQPRRLAEGAIHKTEGSDACERGRVLQDLPTAQIGEGICVHRSSPKWPL